MSVLRRHVNGLGYVLRVILPLLLRNRRRPVIFSRRTGLGDIICTIPEVQELRKRHPGAFFIYNCHRDFAAVPKLAGVADLVTTLEPIGIVGHWYHFLLAGFYHFAHGDDHPDSGCKEPMVAEFCRQFGLPAVEEHPELPVAPAAREQALSMFARKKLDPKKLILIHPGPSWPAREWPHKKWVQLVDELRGCGFTDIAQLGVSRYMLYGKVAVETIPGAVSLVDELSLEECIAAIEQARLFIGIDSGLLHIAAGTRTPAVGIFGMTLPETRFSAVYRKDFVASRVECAGCEHRKPQLHWITGCPYDIKCMKTLPVDEVLRACLAKLQAPVK